MVALIDGIEAIIKRNDSICIIGEDINLGPQTVRMQLNDFLDRSDKFNVVILNVPVTEEKLKALVHEASKRSDVLICDFTREYDLELTGDMSKGYTVPFWSKIARFGDQFKEYPFVFVRSPGSATFVALYFRRMLPDVQM